MNKDYLDILRAFETCGVEYLLVGAYAVSKHGYTRTTGDLDLWVNPTLENATKVWRALEQFGAPRARVKAEDFAVVDWVFQIGVEPQRIDILTGVDGLDFQSAMKQSVKFDIEGVALQTLSLDDLIENKSRTGRPKDQLDVLELKRIRDRVSTDR